jgi:hypothetical protein
LLISEDPLEILINWQIISSHFTSIRMFQ